MIHSAPEVGAISPYVNLAEAIISRSLLRPQELKYRQLAAKSLLASPKEVTNIQYVNNVRAVAGYLSKIGIEPGDRIAILSNNRPEFMESHLGILRAGAVVVPCYTSDPVQRLAYVLRDSEIKAAFVENQQQLEKLTAALQGGIEIPAIESEGRAAWQTKEHSLLKIIHFEDVSLSSPYTVICEHFGNVRESGLSACDMQKIRKLTGAASEASILYTAGSSGTPKGVVAEHRNHISNLMQIEASGIVDDIRSAYQLLPLSHGFGLQLLHVQEYLNILTIFSRVADPKSSKLTDKARRIMIEDMARSNADLIALVPRVLESIMLGIEEKAKGHGPLSSLLNVTLDTYLKKYQAELEGKALDPQTQKTLDRLESKMLGAIGPSMKQMIKNKIVGKNFKHFVAGGATLPLEIYDKYTSLGMTVYNGYGSTESNVPISVNTPIYNKRGTVGKPFPGLEVDISEAGEVLVRGPNVAAGYHQRPAAQAKSFQAAGCLNTNDRGYLDEDGFLVLGGNGKSIRMDDVEVLSSGKNVELGPLEKIVKQHSKVKDAVVVAEGLTRPIAIAVVDEVYFKSANKMELNDIGLSIVTHANSIIQKNSERLSGVVVIEQPTFGKGLSNKFTLQRWKLIELYRKEIDQLNNDQLLKIVLPILDATDFSAENESCSRMGVTELEN